MDGLPNAKVPGVRGRALKLRAPTGRRPDLDYIRAAAVLAVVLFHLDAPGFARGFVGVDIFFVLSGYLITELVAAGHYASIGDFYAARLWRLGPALAVVVLSTLVVFLGAGLAADRGALLASGAASLLFLGNIRLAAAHGLYAGQELARDPFTHLWTLGVEAQFYLTWPALLFALRGRRGVLAILATAIAAASFGLCQVVAAHDQPLAFFSFPSRAWEFMAGAIVALAPKLERRTIRRIAVAAGCGVSLAALALVGPVDAYPGVSALLPTCGAALILLGLRSNAVSAAAHLFPSAVAAFGRLSYDWYLWHWPLLVVLQRFDPTAGWPARVTAEAVALALAGASHRFLGHPIAIGRRRDRLTEKG